MANWTEEEKREIWNKGEIVPGYDKNIWRKDQCGALIKWNCYGDRSSQTNCGWEIDHRNPVANGGTDDLWNLDPLQWNNNRSKSDDYPEWKTSKKAGVSMRGLHYNIDKKQCWKIK